MSGLRGAGPSGGLLFVALLLFVGWLVASETAGLLRMLLIGLLVVVTVAVGVNVARRR